uniref:C2 domain-containing protein n=1 Tax=Pyrodinium bahamense TaxID=73915 RepID=A0A7S0FI35_9DINO
MDSFQEVQQLNSLKFFEGQVLQLSKAWRQRDCPFTGYLKLDEVVSLLLDIPEPVGFAGGGGSRRHVLHQMRWMRLYSDKTVHYRDVVMLSAKRSCLWLRSDYEKNLGSVSFEASALEQWKNHFEAMPRATVHRMRRLSMGSVDSTFGPTDSMDSTAFFERRAAHMDSKYEILIGHVICGAYISAYADRKRRQWMLDSQGELGARRQALEEGRALVASQGRWTVGPKDAEPPAIVPTRDVQVAIVSARGLRNADGGYGTSDSYCRCNVLGKPQQWIQTEVISSTEPTWNHEAELLDVAEGEHLEFAVYDDDFGSKTHEVLGQAVLESAHFHPQGFDGELRLDNAGPGQEAFLSIRVAPAPGDAAGAAASDGIGLGGPYPSEQAAAKEPAQPNILVTQLLPPPESSAVQQLSPLPWPPTLPQLQPEKK